MLSAEERKARDEIVVSCGIVALWETMRFCTADIATITGLPEADIDRFLASWSRAGAETPDARFIVIEGGGGE
ncbi:hypothetical protein [Notoacmeibacter sp. MSK16QG-6]|uniref:hypothetical protein n=1 Tax=Notoacmeibacter sp. MSK16QG-6 TaxID=2957982 RepID=UPI0020A22F2E|nr:hypothetical protein [Notoacmeibacter sp. MSK16QG-6]MCP1200082.1 hypothetical protein [Notoacmeibacter sp. MSK16QG-6]